MTEHRDWYELIHPDDAIDQVRELARTSSGRVEILPCESADGQRALGAMQVTTRSHLGPLAYRTGGLLQIGVWVAMAGCGPRVEPSQPGETGVPEITVEPVELVADDPFEVSLPEPNLQHHATVALLEEGLIGVAWGLGVGMPRGEVVFRTFEMDGAPQTTPMDLHPGEQTPLHKPDVSTDGEAFWVGWESASFSIHARGINGRAGFGNAPAEVQAANADSSGSTDVAVLEGGERLVAWYRGDDDPHGIEGTYLYRLFSDEGVLLGPETVVASTKPGRSMPPDVVALPGGGFAMAWISRLELDPANPDIATSSAVRLGVFDRSLGLIQELDVVSNSPDQPGRPQLDVNGRGELAVVWKTLDASDHRRLHMQTFDADHVPLAPIRDFDDLGELDHINAVFVDDDRVAVAWDLSPEPYTYDVYLHLVGFPEMEPLTQPVVVNGDTENNLRPALASQALDDGRTALVTTWEAGPEEWSEVYARVFWVEGRD